MTTRSLPDGIAWARPMNAAKFHLIDAATGRSLCGRWHYFERADGRGIGPLAGARDCVACHRRGWARRTAGAA